MSTRTGIDPAEPSTAHPVEHFYDVGPYRLHLLKQRLPVPRAGPPP
jgi:hypothetical protein